MLAFCQTLLGNFRCAATAYRKAIASAPANPWYAHNLGHLLDVALGSPDRALPWLRSAHSAKAENSEIVASYVHALARAGQTGEARAVLERALARFDASPPSELEALLRWLDQGAPSRAERGPVGKPALESSHDRREKRAAGAAKATAADKREKLPKDRRLARVLERGLSHLPLDSRQRERALALARDVLADAARLEARSARSAAAAARKERPAPKAVAAARDDLAGLAAAVAYAIVYVDHVPLSHAEVAAPFRVAVARLRGRFAELRAKLDIIPGDARYATTRGC